MFESETSVNDAQAQIIEDYMGLGAGSGFPVNNSVSNNEGAAAGFLGESPMRWFLFIGMILLWLFLWGSIVHYLGGK